MLKSFCVQEKETNIQLMYSLSKKHIHIQNITHELCTCTVHVSQLVKKQIIANCKNNQFITNVIVHHYNNYMYTHFWYHCKLKVNAL